MKYVVIGYHRHWSIESLNIQMIYLVHQLILRLLEPAENRQQIKFDKAL